MELQPLTTPLHILDGHAQTGSAPPGVYALSAPADAARSRARDYLLAHLSLSGPLDETAPLLEALMVMLARSFFQASGSVTAALRDAVQTTNQYLLRHNLQGSGAVRTGALVCAVLRERELYMAQVGEGLALVGHSFGLERLPPQEPPTLTPLGVSAGLDVRYYHHWLQEGDTLLLLDPRLAYLPTSAFVPALVQTRGGRRAEALTGLLTQQSARLLLVELRPGIRPNRLPDTPTTVSGPVMAPTRTPVRDPEFMADEIRARRRRMLTEMTQQGRDSAESAPIPPAALPDDADETEAEDEPEETSAYRPLNRLARQAASQTAGGLSRLTGGLARLLARLRQPADEEPERPAERALATILAIIIPILIAVIVVGVYIQRGEVSRLTEIRLESQTALDNGRQAERNGEDARPYYQQVLLLADEADTLRPDDPDIRRARQEASGALDRLQGITRLEATTLFQFDPTADLDNLALRPGGGGFYVLDSANSRVHFLPTDDAYTPAAEAKPDQLLAANDVVAAHVVSKIVDIVWRPQGLAVSLDGLAMLDAGGAIVTYHPAFVTRRAAPLDLASQWRQPISLATYLERVYVLDPAAGQIWRYLPNGDGFTIEAGYQAIILPDLSQAVDMAFYEDGSLVVAYGNGSVRRYDSGRELWDETTLLSNGLSAPLVAPQAVKVSGSGLNSSIFIADPGSARIVQVSLAGVVLAEYKATTTADQELFGQIKDFAVLETPLRLFVVAGRTLAVAQLP